jgi:hypothetical protein
MDKIEIKPITLEQYKSFMRGKGVEPELSDEDLQMALDLGNKKEQDYINERAERAEKHRSEMRSLFLEMDRKGLPG